MNALTIIAEAGVQASIEPAGGLKLRGLSKLSVEHKNQIISYARKHKHAILAALTKSSATGDCDSCPASGYWDYIGSGKWCFYTAYFIGRSGKPEPCKTAQHNCPLKK